MQEILILTTAIVSLNAAWLFWKWKTGRLRFQFPNRSKKRGVSKSK